MPADCLSTPNCFFNIHFLSLYLDHIKELGKAQWLLPSHVAPQKVQQRLDLKRPSTFSVGAS
jgi:hypothetical protein